MDTADIWKRVLVGAIAAVLMVVVIGGAYLLYAWFKVGSGSALNGTPVVPAQQERKALDSFTAPASTSTPAQQGAGTPSPETPSVFDAPAQSAPTQVPPTPSSFDAPSS